MMGGVSDQDINVARTLLDRLCDKIASIPVSSPIRTAKLADTLLPARTYEADDNLGSSSSLYPSVQAVAVDAEQLDATVGENQAEVDSLKAQRGHLLLVLMDQASAVNANLLEYCLSRISWFLGEEEASPAVSRQALSDQLFKTVATRMDMTKRQRAAKWYLNFRQDLEQAEETRAKL